MGPARFRCATSLSSPLLPLQILPCLHKMKSLLHLFTDFLQILGICEAQIESMRLILAENPDFDVLSVFKVINYKKNGVISKDEMHHFAETHGISATSLEIEAFLREIDRNNDGNVSLFDFEQAILPVSSVNLREVAGSRGSKGKKPGREVMSQVLRWVNYELEYVRRSEPGKREMERRCGGGYTELFREIGGSKAERFNLEDLQNYCRRVNFPPSTLQVAFRRLCRSLSHTVSYPSFHQSLRPSLSPVPSPPSPDVSPVLPSSPEHLFPCLCIDIARLELRLESIRRDLSCRADFTIEDSYRLFTDTDVHLSLFGFKTGLGVLGLFATDREITRLGRRIAEEGVITLKDWERYLTPLEQGYAVSMTWKVPVRATGEERKFVFTHKTVSLLRLFFGTALENERFLYEKVSEIALKPFLNRIFDMIDCDKDGEISVSDLELGLDRLGERLDRTGVMLVYGRLGRGRKVKYADLVREVGSSTDTTTF